MRISRALLAIALLSAGVIASRDAAAQGHAVITGRVVDEQGLPVVNGRVTAWARDLSAGYWRSRQAAQVQTDDRGIYRVHSLNPGRYVVCAARGFQPPPLDEGQRLRREIDFLRQTAERELGRTSETARERLADLMPRLPARIEPVRDFVPACYTDKSGTRVTLGLADGEERTGIDLALARTRLARIEGSVTGLTLAPDETAELQLWNEDEELGDVREGGVVAGGGFSLWDVPPGRYALVLTVRPRAARSYTLRTFGAMPIVVRDDDVRGVQFAVPKQASVTGQVVARGRSEPAAGTLEQFTVLLTPVAHDAFNERGNAHVVRPDADGRFTFPEVRPGSYRIIASPRALLPWFLESVTAGARDVTFDSVDLRPGQALSDVVIALTDRRASLAGTVLDETDKPAPEFLLIVYADDVRYRTGPARRIHFGRASADGDYVITGIRPGTYRVATLRTVPVGAWSEEGFLDRLDPQTTKVTIAGEGQTILNLRVRSTDR